MAPINPTPIPRSMLISYPGLRPVQTKGPWPIYGEREKARRLKRWWASLTKDELQEIRVHQDNWEIIFSFDSEEVGHYPIDSVSEQ